MKRFVVMLVLAMIVAAFGPGDAQPVPYEITAITSLTGAGAFIGKAQAESFRLIEGYVNKNGGVRGHPVKFLVLDDQTNPVVAVQLFNQAIAKKAAVVLGPALTATCAAVTPLVKSGPVDYCLSPGIEPARGSYVFSASDSLMDQAIVLLRYFRLRGWTRVGLITSTDATGQAMTADVAAAAALPENASMQIVANERFNAADVSVAAQMSRIKSSNPHAVIAWSTGTQFGTLLRGINDIGLDVPVGAGTGNMNNDQLSQYAGFMPKALFFPGLQSLVSGGPVPKAVRDAQNAYYGVFKAAGLTPGFLNNLAWDPTMLVLAALRANGIDAGAEQIRSHIDNLQGWAGVNGLYDFKQRPGRGIGPAASVIDQWDVTKGTFTVVSKPGGFL